MSQPVTKRVDPTQPFAGYATVKGTHRYRQRFSNFSPQHFRPSLSDAQNSLWLGCIGIGTYLGGLDAESSAHLIHSLSLALRSGCNVIDTAPNYRHTQSEQNIGQALADLLLNDECDFQRDEFVICSKGGYLLQRNRLEHSARDNRAFDKRPFADQIVNGDHCMAPAFLADQITRSLANLQLETIDIYYIQNPEVQLDSISSREFANRIRAAFVQLEKEVANGRIRSYGIATWDGLRVPPTHLRHLSLAKLMRTAREAGGAEHHFRAIQFPYNLGMLETLIDENQVVDIDNKSSENPVSVLTAAAEYGLLSIGSMGLMQGQLARQLPTALKDLFRDAYPVQKLETDAQVALQINRSTPQLTTTLVGMQSYLHVQENLRLGRVPPIPQEAFFDLFGL